MSTRVTSADGRSDRLNEELTQIDDKMAELRNNAFNDESLPTAPPAMHPDRVAAASLPPPARTPTPPLGPNFFAPPPGYRTQREREKEKQQRRDEPRAQSASHEQSFTPIPQPAPQRQGFARPMEQNGMALSQMTLYGRSRSLAL